MAQFDVYRDREDAIYLLDCQSDILDHLSTRFVVPLLPAGEVPKATRLNPVFDVNGESVVMATHLASSVAARDLSAPVAALGLEHPAIVNALDMLITGY